MDMIQTFDKNKYKLAFSQAMDIDIDNDLPHCLTPDILEFVEKNFSDTCWDASKIYTYFDSINNKTSFYIKNNIVHFVFTIKNGLRITQVRGELIPNLKGYSDGVIYTDCNFSMCGQKDYDNFCVSCYNDNGKLLEIIAYELWCDTNLVPFKFTSNNISSISTYTIKTQTLYELIDNLVDNYLEYYEKISKHCDTILQIKQETGIMADDNVKLSEPWCNLYYNTREPCRDFIQCDFNYNDIIEQFENFTILLTKINNIIKQRRQEISNKSLKIRINDIDDQLEYHRQQIEILLQKKKECMDKLVSELVSD